MYINRDFVNEIYDFLLKDLLNEKLSDECTNKLTCLIQKIDILLNNLFKQNAVDEDENPYETPLTTIHEENIKLPTKLTKSSSNHPETTLLGGLYYRYNYQCWDHYPHSYLYNNRLICEKKSANTQNNSQNSSTFAGKSNGLSIFLIGYTAVETGKDCGMNHVFKLTHPTEETKVFATDTEEECTAWVEQINLYSQGITPSEEKSFRKQHFSEYLDENVEFGTIISSGSEGTSSIDDVHIRNSENSHLRRQPSDVLSIINNSVGQRSSIIISDKKFNRSRSSHAIKAQTTAICSTAMGNFAGGNNNSNNSSSNNNNSIISSVRRKVESIGNKYRNRKSFAGFSSSQKREYMMMMNGIGTSSPPSSIISPNSSVSGTSSCTQSSNVSSAQVNKSRTMPQISPDYNRRCSFYLQLHKDAIFGGVAKLRVQGNRSGWIERWCQLKPRLLECYHLPTVNSNSINGNNAGGSSNSSGGSAGPVGSGVGNLNNGFSCYNGNSFFQEPVLDFALCLEDLSLGLSNDKKHRSALRLSCDSVKQDLLFEVLDKVVMGDWIKAFIEALGIGNPVKHTITDLNSIDLTQNNQGTIEDNQTSFAEDESKEVATPVTEDVMQKSITTIHSESVYDEVVSTDGRLSDLNPSLMTLKENGVYEKNTISTDVEVNGVENIKSRRWSSPNVQVPKQVERMIAKSICDEQSTNEITSGGGLQPPLAPYAGRRTLRDHPLPSLPASSPDSETNSDSMTETPTRDDYDVDNRLYDYTLNSFSCSQDRSRASTLRNTKVKNKHEEAKFYQELETSLPVPTSFTLDRTIQNQRQHECMVSCNCCNFCNPESSGLLQKQTDRWRVQGCSLADLVARLGEDCFKRSSSVKSNRSGTATIGTGNEELSSSSTVSSNRTTTTDESSSAASTFQNSLPSRLAVKNFDGENSESTSFISVNSLDSSKLFNIEYDRQKVCRSISADTNLANIVIQETAEESSQTYHNSHPDKRKQRPKSLLMRKTSLEMVLEEIASVKEDIRCLKMQKKNLKNSNNSSNSIKRTDQISVATVNNVIENLNSQLTFKENRLKELSSYSKKRFTIEVAATKLNRSLSQLSAD